MLRVFTHTLQISLLVKYFIRIFVQSKYEITLGNIWDIFLGNWNHFTKLKKVVY